MTPDLNDDLESLFGPGLTSEPTTTNARPLAPDLQEAADRGGFFENCRKCGGSGRYGNLGRCFACNGKGGKQFKTSPTARATNRQKAQDRKESRQQLDLENFQTANPEIFNWIQEAAPTFSFAASMLDAIRKWGALTDGQLAACQKCVDARKARKAAAVAAQQNAPAIDVSKIELAFATAREKAQRPGAMGVWVKPLRLQAADRALTFSTGSTGSQWEGMVFVKEGDAKLGYVKNGKFFRRQYDCTDAQEAAVIEACSDPHKAAVAYGRAWSVCSVCGITLTDPKSIARGIGPICAEKFGW